MGFLRDIESPYEVKDYVRQYLGEGEGASDFARQFLERRSKWRSERRSKPVADDMCAPAPAVNPTPQQSSHDFQEVKVSKVCNFALLCNFEKHRIHISELHE